MIKHNKTFKGWFEKIVMAEIKDQVKLVEPIIQ